MSKDLQGCPGVHMDVQGSPGICGDPVASAPWAVELQARALIGQNSPATDPIRPPGTSAATNWLLCASTWLGDPGAATIGVDLGLILEAGRGLFPSLRAVGQKTPQRLGFCGFVGVCTGTPSVYSL